MKSSRTEQRLLQLTISVQHVTKRYSQTLSYVQAANALSKILVIIVTSSSESDGLYVLIARQSKRRRKRLRKINHKICAKYFLPISCSASARYKVAATKYATSQRETIATRYDTSVRYERSIIVMILDAAASKKRLINSVFFLCNACNNQSNYFLGIYSRARLTQVRI